MASRRAFIAEATGQPFEKALALTWQQTVCRILHFGELMI
jgi:hypothetical protein